MYVTKTFAHTEEKLRFKTGCYWYREVEEPSSVPVCTLRYFSDVYSRWLDCVRWLLCLVTCVFLVVVVVVFFFLHLSLHISLCVGECVYVCLSVGDISIHCKAFQLLSSTHRRLPSLTRGTTKACCVDCCVKDEKFQIKES